MRKYEIMYIIRPTVLEDDRKVLVEELNTIVTSRGGAILEQNEWGMKDLAYEIQKHKSGYYYFLVANTTTEANKEFERICGISKENIIRFMVVNIDGIKASTLDTLRK